ncbi:dihydrofolate reductase family protein [Gordonia sp. DT30]|uniref:dihydrofolate reductase family protein n=1 Tax=Gordonia sp. DT30 TaxID=3416546 RepID=UPI003CEE1598
MTDSTRWRYYTAMTLDGYLADDHDDLSWLLSQPIDENGPMNHSDFIGDIGAIVMGATTYQWLLENELGLLENELGLLDNELAQGRPWPYTVPTFLFTHRALDPVSATIRVVSGDPSSLRADIDDTAAGKDVWIVGGGGLAAQFARAGMLDEIIVSIAPVTLGSGRPLFTEAFDLTLVDYARNEAFLCARYEVVGPRDPVR